MSLRTIIERSFLIIIGAAMLWSAPHWAADGLALHRANAPGAAKFLLLAATMLFAASLMIYVGARGRAPRWLD